LLIGERMNDHFELLRVEGEGFEMKSGGYDSLEALRVGYQPVRRDSQRGLEGMARLDHVDYHEPRPPYRIRRQRLELVVGTGGLISQARIAPLRQQVAGQLKTLGDLVDARKIQHVKRDGH